MYAWKRALIYTAFLEPLDGTGVFAVIRSPRSPFADDGDDGASSAKNAEALRVALSQQKIKDGRARAVSSLPVGETEYVNADSRLAFIPHLGYLAIDSTVVGVECSNGEKVNAITGTRKLGNKVSSFYLFHNPETKTYNGSLGRMGFTVSPTDKSDVWHLQIISY